jgi:Holliday junction resolvasome RuvABC endonuclease subunit
LPYQWVLYVDIKSLATKYKVGYHEYHPITIKKTVTGSGRAEKCSIQEILRENISLPGDIVEYTEHMYDSVSAGYCHLKKVGLL